jgi:hypothetical protein
MPKDPKCEPNVGGSTMGSRVTALVSLAATLILAVSRLAEATTINANSASQSDVAAAIASATNGDVVSIPDGTATWTRTLAVRKAITLQGAGIGNTVINDDIQNARIITWTLPAGLPSRLTGIEFRDGGGTHSAPPTGAMRVDGSNTDGSTFRMDHCYWNNINGTPVFDTVIGVLDHNTFYCQRPGWIMIYIYGSNWDGHGPYGDGSWHDPAGYGSSQFLFMEDNTFTYNTGGLGSLTDAFQGARFVVRHNTIHDGVLGNHGTESGGRMRGGRVYEAYNNAFIGSGLSKFVTGCRSGTMIVHDNTISGYWGANAVCALSNYRTHYPFPPWAGADGMSPWDDNEPSAAFTGTAAANSAGTTVTVTGASWTANQWKGYSVRRLANTGNLNTLMFALIYANTSNTITYTDNGGYSTPSLAFTAGDSLEFRKVRHVLDGIGRGQGTLVTSEPVPPLPSGWNNQVSEPCYSWNNVITDGGAGAKANFGDVDASIRINEHYFNDTPMPGYTPYVYPHPLVTGNPLPSQPPSSPAATRTSLRKPWGGKQKETKRVRKLGRKAKENSGNETAEGQKNLGD